MRKIYTSAFDADLPWLTIHEHKMKIKLNAVCAAIVVSIFVPSVSCASEMPVPQAAAAQRSKGLEAPFGYATKAAPDRVIEVVAGKTKAINVTRLETVRIVDGPRSVTWTFDTLGVPLIPLAAILPNATKVLIYVEENPMYAN